MKKLFYLIVAAMACVRCDVMDTSALDQYSADVVWSDKSLAQAYLYNTYNDVFFDYVLIAYEGGEPQWDVNTNYYKFNGYREQPGSSYGIYADDLVSREIVNASVNNNTFSANQDAGWNIFGLIRQTNVAIEGATSSMGMSEADKKNVIAQAKVLRGMVYFKHARIFGGAILIDKALKPSDELHMHRSTIKETYDFVINDFLTAGPDLAANTTTGNISGTLAYGLAAQAALQAAAYVGEDEKLVSDVAEYNGKSYYDVALAASEKCIAITNASLSDDYYGIFNDHPNVESNPEVILAFSRGISTCQNCKTPNLRTGMQYSVANQADFVNPKVSATTMAVTCFQASMDLVDSYEVVEDGVAKKWDETEAFKNFRPGTDYVYNIMSKNRDQRYYDSFVFDSCQYGPNNDWIYTRVKGNQHADSGKTEDIKNWTGYYIRKAMIDTKATLWGTKNDYNYILFRMGTVYLNYAEALLRTGRIEEAVENINKTRVTHGNLPALESTLSEAEVWAEYKNERRKDLFFEGDDRYYSLLRWAKIDGDVSDLEKDLNKKYEIAEDGKSYEVTELPNNWPLAAQSAVHLWSERRFLFPIPQSFINLAGKDENGKDYIQQNPGY